MNSGTFKPSWINAAAGYINNGQVGITSGHYRVVAVAIRGMQIGDYSILQALIRGGNFNFTGNSVEYGYKFFSKFLEQWQ